MIGLITAALLAQISVPSVVVQPSAEERVVFNHNGFTYFVGKMTGQVMVLGADSDPAPVLPPNPLAGLLRKNRRVSAPVIILTLPEKPESVKK